MQQQQQQQYSGHFFLLFIRITSFIIIESVCVNKNTERAREREKKEINRVTIENLWTKIDFVVHID